MDIDMIRPTMNGIPSYPFPDGYWMRHWEKDDLQLWITLNSPGFDEGQINEELFHQEYGTDDTLHTQRIYFLMHNDQVIGTISAWFGDDEYGENYGKHVGRIHWVGIVPEYQGKGLSKPMMSYACHKLIELGHKSAFLHTETELIPALGLYLRFGFQPDINSDELQMAWDEALKLVQSRK